jgi:DNA-binding response OmpR family regulator
MVKKILIAEDDADIRFILNLVLNEAGYQVEQLPAGTTIVEGRKEWPDLFILDKALPTIDGLALCKYLKIKKETKDIPIIMISSYHKLKTKAREAGVDAFIEKPFDLKQLLQVVDKHVNSNFGKTRQLSVSRR